MRFVCTVFLLIRFVVCAQAQINPAADFIYNPSYLATISITIDEADKSKLLAKGNEDSQEYLKCSVLFENEKVKESIENVGIRLRGNTSRTHPKRSFKLKFTEFDGPKFYGYKKFNLKAENNDPSCIREHTSLSVYRAANVPAARSHFAKVYLNNEYMGLYTNVEQVDDEFCDTRFNSESGNLYKCNWGASLSNNNDAYNNGLFELETNKDINDRSILENFIDVLNNTSESEFKTEIEKVLNVDNALRFLAVEAILGHWDGYAYNKNNYYIHENPESKKIEFIAYDVDNTFGIDWIPGDWAKRDLLNWASESEERPLHNTLLEVPEYYEKYVSILWELLNGPFNEDELFPEFDRLRSMLSDAVENDTYYPQTFGYDFSDFNKSHTEQVVKHCPYGLKPYVSTRTETALDQLPIINSIAEIELRSSRVKPTILVNRQGFVLLTTENDLNIGQIQIFDMSGRQISFGVSSGLKPRVELNGKLEPGMYFLKTSNYVQQLLVQ